MYLGWKNVNASLEASMTFYKRHEYAQNFKIIELFFSAVELPISMFDNSPFPTNGASFF